MGAGLTHKSMVIILRNFFLTDATCTLNMSLNWTQMANELILVPLIESGHVLRGGV